MKVQCYTESEQGRSPISVPDNTSELFNTMFDMLLFGGQVQYITPTKVHLFMPIHSIVTVVKHLVIEGNLEEMYPFHKLCKEVEVADALSTKLALGGELHSAPQHLSKLNLDPAAKVRDLKSIVLRMLSLPEDTNANHETLTGQLFETLTTV